MSYVIHKTINRIYKKIRYLFVNGIASSIITPQFIRFIIYKLFLMDVRTTKILSRCFFSSSKISIGRGTLINNDCYFESYENIIIGKYVSIAPQVMICASTHEIGLEHKRAGKAIGQKVIIEDGCWIGTRVVILPGVKIGMGCIIAAGAVVTKDCEPNGIYAGVPAKRLKDIESTEDGMETILLAKTVG
ncbi:maltose O-acetyltransferase [Paenibacillus phyllosphaerae]|uniref:Maltose O-acetyltransferase n=1 Tax=Paenibacillus phyllosphaerae TaxID=274593 RepID=A0A7W5ATL2_9BACL|nr:acyltransferase [Paenibacillus phyllosphaerae]MBB3108540.1 maltose O-acetyltransferase [Paenibacillus phyllosphaerae]